MNKVAVTGMAINVPTADTLKDLMPAMMAGRSCISKWGVFEDEEIYSKVGGDLVVVRHRKLPDPGGAILEVFDLACGARVIIVANDLKLTFGW